MKNKGGREAGKCSKVVPDRGDRCLFFFLWSRRLFCNIFPFPVCKAKLIGDWYENRQGALNPIIFLTIRQYYWRTDAPCANSNGGPSTKINPRNLIGPPCLVRIAYWRRGTSVRQYIGAPIHPAPIVLAHRGPCSITNDTPNTFGAPIRDENQFILQKNWIKVSDRTFRCASPIFIPIAY